MWNIIEKAISESSSHPFKIKRRTAISGGCINQTFLLEGDKQRYFIKLNDTGGLPMFDAESAGLQAILDTGTISAPQPLCTGIADNHTFLVMSYINSTGNASNHALLGEQLAAMHRKRFNYFGWHQDNTIGSTIQPNPHRSNWIDFWREQRLGFQLTLAAQNGFGGALQTDGERLMDCLGGLFDGYTPQPSLLHGDLWSGNYCFDQDGTPTIFDPACYYGDREADIAMSELFGGFNSEFYRAYQNAFPLKSGYQTRKTLYNLYHILNHLNLFGEGYLSQAQQMMRQLLSEPDQ